MASLKEKVSRRISTNVEKRISDKQGISNITIGYGPLKSYIKKKSRLWKSNFNVEMTWTNQRDISQ